MRRAWLLALAVGLSACRGCGGPEAPDEYAIGRLVDPYQRTSVAGTQLEQARAILDDVGAQLGYGKVPGDVLAASAGEGWAERQAAGSSRRWPSPSRMASMR